MSTTRAASMSGSMRSGLCIDIPTLKATSGLIDLPHSALSGGHQTSRTSVAGLFPEVSSSVEQPVVSRAHSDDSDTILRRRSNAESNFSLRSITGMQGLLLAENGGGLVELDPLGSGSGFKQGTRVIPGLITPRGGAFGVNVPPLRPDGQGIMTPEVTGNLNRLTRHGTLLSQGVTPARNAAELKSLLGNSRSKVKSGAKVLPPANVVADRSLAGLDVPAVALEQGKSRARVEVDILLDSEVCVEGCYLTGKLHVKVRKRGAKDAPVFLAGGKMRVVGFEGIPDNSDRHTFFQHAASLSAISTMSHVLYSSPPDEEGFSKAREGMHVIPFAMKLPVSDGIHVGAKGIFDNRSGVIVKYIAIASFKLKDNTTSKRSIAHFYRSCEIYPYLDASIVMGPATHPLLSTASRNIFLGGTGKVKLTASLHRNFWVAGQRCCVGIAVHNESKKTVKGLILSLIRTTTIFHPRPHLDVASPNSADPDACQTTTTRKLVAETTLEAGQRGLKGHVTAKGWWTGVEPGARMNFAHFIFLPPNALSIVRSRLLEVQYAIRVSLVVGSLSSEVSVMLPVRIINHLSIDPPPSYPTPFNKPGIPATVQPLPIPIPNAISSAPPTFPPCSNRHEMDKRAKPEGGQLASIFGGPDTRDVECLSGASVMPHRGVSNGPAQLSRAPLPKLIEEDPEADPSPDLHLGDTLEVPEERTELQEIREEEYEDNSYEHEDDRTKRGAGDSAEDLLGNLGMGNSDEEVNYVVGSARLDDDEDRATKFAERCVEDEQAPHCVRLDPMESTISSRSTYSMPSGEEHLGEGLISKESPSRHAAQKRFVPITRSRPKLRPRTPDCDHGLSSPFGTGPKASPPRRSPAYVGQSGPRANYSKSRGFPFPMASTTTHPHQKSPFSQRVDRLIAARRAAVQTPIASMTSDSSDGETPALSTEGAGTQTETSTSENSPVSSPAVSPPLTFATPPRMRKHLSSPSKMPVPTRLTSASPTANSVKCRIAQLEGLCKAASTPSPSSVSSQLHSRDFASAGIRDSSEAPRVAVPTTRGKVKITK